MNPTKAEVVEVKHTALEKFEAQLELEPKRKERVLSPSELARIQDRFDLCFDRSRRLYKKCRCKVPKNPGPKYVKCTPEKCKLDPTVAFEKVCPLGEQKSCRSNGNSFRFSCRKGSLFKRNGPNVIRVLFIRCF